MAEQLPFEDVYLRHADRILRFCLTQVRDPSDAEDIAADVFVSAYAAYARVRPDFDTVHIWLFRIARNKITNHRRRTRLFESLLPGLGRATAARSGQVEDDVVIRDELRRALAATSRLGARDRALVGLRVGAGLDYNEIGTLMGLSQRAAMAATYRAFDKLRILAGEPP